MKGWRIKNTQYAHLAVAQLVAGLSAPKTNLSKPKSPKVTMSLRECLVLHLGNTRQMDMWTIHSSGHVNIYCHLQCTYIPGWGPWACWQCRCERRWRRCRGKEPHGQGWERKRAAKRQNNELEWNTTQTRLDLNLSCYPTPVPVASSNVASTAPYAPWHRAGIYNSSTKAAKSRG